MALDGRRRRLGLLLLRDRGDIDRRLSDRLPPGRDQGPAGGRHRAAEHRARPVHIADVIVAIGKLRKSKMDTRAIAAALGYAELEIQRLEALAAVHPRRPEGPAPGQAHPETGAAVRAHWRQEAAGGDRPDRPRRLLPGLPAAPVVSATAPRSTTTASPWWAWTATSPPAAGSSSDLFGELPDVPAGSGDPARPPGASASQPVVGAAEAEGLAVFSAARRFRRAGGFSACPTSTSAT